MNSDLIEERTGELISIGRNLPGHRAKIAERNRFKKFLLDCKFKGQISADIVMRYLAFRSIKKEDEWLKFESIIQGVNANVPKTYSVFC